MFMFYFVYDDIPTPKGSVDCGPLPDPTNGKVVTPIGTTLERLATYTCDDGYVLSQTGSRICLSSGQWSHTAPTCEPVGKL